MTKIDFLLKLNEKLSGLPEEDVKKSLEYYSEMIDDRMEDGLSEAEAVAAVGEPAEIAAQIEAQILSEMPLGQLVRTKLKPQRSLRVWEIVLLVLGSPVWIPLIASAVATVFSVYVSLWSVVIALYAAAFALCVSAIGCIIGSFFMIGSMPKVIVTWGAALLCAGLAILIFMLSNLAAKGLVALTKWVWNSIFHRKEKAV